MECVIRHKVLVNNLHTGYKRQITIADIYKAAKNMAYDKNKIYLLQDWPDNPGEELKRYEYVYNECHDEEYSLEYLGIENCVLFSSLDDKINIYDCHYSATYRCNEIPKKEKLIEFLRNCDIISFENKLYLENESINIIKTIKNEEVTDADYNIRFDKPTGISVNKPLNELYEQQADGSCEYRINIEFDFSLSATSEKYIESISQFRFINSLVIDSRSFRITEVIENPENKLYLTDYDLLVITEQKINKHEFINYLSRKLDIAAEIIDQDIISDKIDMESNKSNILHTIQEIKESYGSRYLKLSLFPYRDKQKINSSNKNGLYKVRMKCYIPDFYKIEDLNDDISLFELMSLNDGLVDLESIQFDKISCLK